MFTVMAYFSIEAITIYISFCFPDTSIFLEDFKGLLAQILNQNSLILNMLTTILNKIH
jgi:hypothetical protein